MHTCFLFLFRVGSIDVTDYDPTKVKETEIINVKAKAKEMELTNGGLFEEKREDV